MASKSRKAKRDCATNAQLELYPLVGDRTTAFEPIVNSPIQLKSAEEITAQNRAAAAQSLFVIKKHRATRLHYDLRLRWNWVMLSWAIPEGPSYCPEHQRQAIQVEDHARENVSFEGVFPQGRPGAGEVILWDRGTWELQPGCIGVEKALREGRLKFAMHGEKIKGNWTLIREAGLESNQRAPLWLLIKDRDEFARASCEPSILDEAPNSVITGRSLEETARYWIDGKTKSRLQPDLFDIISDTRQ